jgi:transposase
MQHFVGLDVSVEETAICIINQDGRVMFEGCAASDPERMASVLRQARLQMARMGLEAGPLAPWIYGGLVSAKLPAICIETRRMKAFASALRVKTDRRDARLIAQAMRVGLPREVHVKTAESQKLRAVLTYRRALLGQLRQLEKTIRGTLKAFGLKIGKVGSKGFAERVRERIAGDTMLEAAMVPVLRIHAELRVQFSVLDRLVLDAVRHDAVCRRLMSVPGIGPVIALAYRTAVDVPQRFSKSRQVAVHFGLTPSKYASGETDHTGGITKCGDAEVGSLLFEGAMTLLTQVQRWSWLKRWGLEVAKRRGLKRACVAVARKLAMTC